MAKTEDKLAEAKARRARLALKKHEKLCFPELNRALRTTRQIHAVGLDRSSLGPAELAVQLDKLRRLGVREYLKGK